MHYHKCNSCGYLNEVKTEHLIFCNGCNLKLENNFTFWNKQHPHKSFNDYINEICVNESVKEQTLSSQNKEKRIKSAAPFIGVTLGFVLFAIIIFVISRSEYAYILKHIETYQSNKILNTNEWLTITNKAGSFKIDFPKNPVSSEQAVQSEIGELTLHIMQHQPLNIDTKNFLYFVSYTDYPSDIINSESLNQDEIEQFYSNTINGTAKSIEGNIESVLSTTIDSISGKKAKITIPHQNIVLNITYVLSQNRLYILQVASSPENENNEDAKRFFNSFTVLK